MQDPDDDGEKRTEIVDDRAPEVLMIPTGRVYGAPRATPTRWGRCTT